MSEFIMINFSDIKNIYLAILITILRELAQMIWNLHVKHEPEPAWPPYALK